MTRAPMSSAQRRLYLQCRTPDGDRAYHLVHVARVRGPFPLDGARAFIDRMTRRHDALRSSFFVEDGEFVCEIADAVEAPLTLLDRGDFDPDRDLDALVAACDGPFDPAAAPLFRVFVQPVGADDRILVVVFHHLIFDGRSAALAADEMRELLSGGDPAPPAKGYADFARWEAEFRGSEEYARQRAHWLERYQTPPARLPLPVDRPRPGRRSFAGASIIDYAELAGVRELARDRGVTVFMTLLAAFFCALHRLTGAREMTVGTLVSPRSAGGFERTVGLFANTLPLTGTVDPDRPFTEVLDDARALVLGAMRNAEYPFEHLVAELPFVERNEWNPLLDVVFNFERTGGRRVETVGPTTVETIDRYADVAMFDLSVDLVEYEDEVRVRLEYSTALFDDETARGILRGYLSVVRAVVADPDALVRDLSLVSEADARRLAVWNDTARPAPTGTYLDLWRKRAASQPDFPALRLDGEEMSYERVEQRSNRLARALAERGITSGVVVASALDGSMDWPVLLLAIWKLGAVHLPLSPDGPRSATRTRMEDADAAIIVLRDGDAEGFADTSKAATIGELARRAALLPSTDPGPGPAPGDPAYIIFTSGSTGRPRGVVVEHRALLSHIDAVRGVYRLRSDDNVSQFASPTFDAALEQVLIALAEGACATLFPSRHLSPDALLEALDANEITVAEFPPALLRELIPHLRPRSLRRLRRLLSGGDRLDAWTAAELSRFLSADARLLNIYGPTEATMAASVFTVPTDLSRWEGANSLPIGKPLPNTRFFILGPGDAPSPPGVAGELAIAGDRLARGYLNLPEITAERFVRITVGGIEERVYKTGDRARFNDDGDVEFLGRLDRQVKLRGHRVELGEIERTLADASDVEEAVVVVRGEGAEARLAAFIVPQKGASPDPRALREFARERLPAHMIPATITAVDGLPLGASGKVDLAALPDDDARGADAPRPPIDALEWAVWAAWREALGHDAFGRDETLEEIGGNSLIAVRLMVEIKARFGIDAPLSLMLSSPTVAGTAEYLRRSDPARVPSLVARFGREEGRAIILLPGLGGQLLDLGDLIRDLARDTRVLGVQYPPISDIEGLAERAAVEIGDAAAGAVLVGHSFGAHVAFELARRLEAAGTPPGAVVALDAGPPGSEWSRYEPSRAGLLDLTVRTLLGGPDAAVWPDTDEGAAFEPILDRALALLRDKGRIAGDTEPADLAAALEVMRGRAVSLAGRCDIEMISADIHLVQASDTVRADWDWAPFTSGRFVRRTASGGHFDMIKGANASACAGVVRELVR